MAGFEDIAKKAFYMGVGFASYAQEKANDTVKDLRVQAQKLAEEMAERGEMSAEEARKFVDEMVEQAQQGQVPGNDKKSESKAPRRIEIVDEAGEKVAKEASETASTSAPPTAAPETEKSASTSSNSSGNSEDLRQQVQSLQEELRRLKKEM